MKTLTARPLARLVRGVSLTEVLFSVSISAAIMMGLAHYATAAVQSGNRVHTQADAADAARKTALAVGDAAKSGDMALTSFPTCPTHPFPDDYLGSQASNSLVLRIPRFDDEGNVRPGQFDVVAFFTQRVTHPEPHYALRVARGSIENGQKTPLNLADDDLNIAVDEFKVGYLASQTVEIEPGRKLYMLAQPPLPSAELRSKVIVGGEDIFASGQASIAGKQLMLAHAPTQRGLATVIFPVNGRTAAKSGNGNNANFVRFRIIGRTVSDQGVSDERFVIEDTVQLRNSTPPVNTFGPLIDIVDILADTIDGPDDDDND